MSNNILQQLIDTANGMVNTKWASMSSLSPRMLQIASTDLLDWIKRRRRLGRSVALDLSHLPAGYNAVSKMLETIPDLNEVFEKAPQGIQFRSSLPSDQVAELEKYVDARFELEIET